MVSEDERKRIKELMQRINQAKREGLPREEIERRAQDLYNYLHERGYLDQFLRDE